MNQVASEARAKYVVVGTAGHIDHGKSALVMALTGTNPDRLEEEKRRGITIDLGFAHLDLGDGLRIAFVDVPGHERFVKNMLAGVGGIDLVTLVVAADESIKPQTREHFDICKLLGIAKGLVVLTKTDLVEREMLDLVALEVQELVKGSFLEGAPIVPVSARTGDGLDKLKDELRRLSGSVAPRSMNRPFRLPIDRAFVMKGFGAVITGTLITGKIQREAEVEIYPTGRRARVRGIEVHNQPSDEAVAGQRTAINLAGVEADELGRGMTLAPPAQLESSSRLDVSLELLPSVRPLRNRSQVHFHCWTAETTANVILLGPKELGPGERTGAQLRLAHDGLFLPGDRFIIRQFSPLITLGGGVVLDNLPPERKASDKSASDDLRELEKAGAGARLEILVQRQGEISAQALVARTGWEYSEMMKVARELIDQRRLIDLGPASSLLVSPQYFENLAMTVAQQLDRFHTANPLAPGLSKEDLRGRSCHRSRQNAAPGTVGSAPQSRESALPSSTLFDLVLQDLSRRGKVIIQGELVRLAGREVQLSEEEAGAKAAIGGAFAKAGLTVPSAREVLGSLRIDRPRAERLLQILLKEKVLVKVAEDLIFHQGALAGLRAMVAQRKAQSNRLNVGVFKEMTGLSRKYAIPLLEYLDRERVTRRQGDERIIL